MPPAVTPLRSVRIDLTEGEFDDKLIDLHVSTGGRGSITIIVPRGVGVQITHHRGGVDSRLEPAVPGLPVVRLGMTTNSGESTCATPVPTQAQRIAAGDGRAASDADGHLPTLKLSPDADGHLPRLMASCPGDTGRLRLIWRT